jgi:hypothetical protein
MFEICLPPRLLLSCRSVVACPLDAPTLTPHGHPSYPVPQNAVEQTAFTYGSGCLLQYILYIYIT